MAGKTTKKRRIYVQQPVKIPADVLLLDAAVRVVAQKGVENTTTRAIAAEAGNGITDTVIYRFFSGKEDLLRKAFLRENNAFMQEIDKMFTVLWEKNLSREQRLRFLWHVAWTWLTQHKSECTFMVRYYYSAYFDEDVQRDYREIWRPLADRLHDLLPDADTDSLIFIALETTVAAGYPVCAGWRPDSASASEYGFRRLFGGVNGFLAE